MLVALVLQPRAIGTVGAVDAILHFWSTRLPTHREILSAYHAVRAVRAADAFLNSWSTWLCCS